MRIRRIGLVLGGIGVVLAMLAAVAIITQRPRAGGGTPPATRLGCSPTTLG